MSRLGRTERRRRVLLVSLATDGTGVSLQVWERVNGAYWLSQPMTLTCARSGSHTLRIQVREDGVQFEPANNDATIVPKP
jgi:hypothetical protein